MDYYKNVNKLYIIVFFHHLIPAYVIERLFWEERGMTVLMVVLCEIIYAASVVIFEIPTGILADKFGRKLLLVFGAVLSMLEFIILVFAYHFWTFALVVFLAGLAKACTSGALNALLYDSLVEEKKQHLFEKIIGRMNTLDLTAALLAAISGGLLANYYGFEFNYVLSAGSMFIALGATLLLKDPSSKMILKVEKERNPFKEYFIHSVSFFQYNPKLLIIVTHAMVVVASINYLDEFWQLYLDEVGFFILYFGFFSAVISLAGIPGNLIAAYLLKYFSVERIILVVLGVTSFGFFMSAVFPGVVGAGMMILIFLASGVLDPVVTGYLHHNGKTEIRATIESMQSMIQRCLMLVIGVGFGVISSDASVVTGFFFLGVVTCMFFCSLLFRPVYQRVLEK